MRHTTPTDIALRTARQHPGVRQLPDLDGFDCELPDDARNELLAPKRARMLGRPIQRMPRRWLKRLSSFVVIIVTPFAVFALLLGIITLCGIGTHSHTPGRDILLERTFHPMPAPTPVVQPPVVQAPAPREEVRRAEFVPVAVKRAALWRLPTQPLGVYEWYPLPEVRGVDESGLVTWER